jgi:hypothetical protein
MSDDLRLILDRLDVLEKRIEEIDYRTIGLQRMGPNRRAEEDLEVRRRRVIEAIVETAKNVPPPDRSQVSLADGSPVTPDHREIKDNGQQKGYVVLTDAERAKGFIRPVSSAYRHLKCGTVTTMGYALAETYARDPQFYTGTFCVGCGKHFPVGVKGEFVWDGTDDKVGT